MEDFSSSLASEEPRLKVILESKNFRSCYSEYQGTIVDKQRGKQYLEGAEDNREEGAVARETAWRQGLG